MTDYQRRFEALLDYSPDGEDCKACYAIEDVCPFHAGIVYGLEWICKHLGRIAEDPEILNALAERKAVTS